MGGIGATEKCMAGIGGAAIAGPMLLGCVGRETNPQHPQAPQPGRPPQRQSFQSSLGQRILTLVLALAVIRFLAGLPSCLHALATHAAADIEVSDCTLEIMSRANGYVTYTWHVELHNKSEVNHVVSVKCDFTDSLGMAVYTDKVTDVEVRPGETLKFKDNCAIPQLTAIGVTGGKVHVY